jgi:hypothetical protein
MVCLRLAVDAAFLIFRFAAERCLGELMRDLLVCKPANALIGLIGVNPKEVASTLSSSLLWDIPYGAGPRALLFII